VKREEKIAASKKLAEELPKYKTIGFIDLFKTPTKEYKEIKRKIGDKALIKVYKRCVITHAFDAVGGEIVKLKEYIPSQAALILSNEDPFELFAFISSLKTETYAKPGDVAEEEIVVKAGPTDIPPGPVISEFAKAKIPAGVEGGKIAIKRDTVVAKPGDVITPEIASILRKLKIKPIKIGLKVVAFYHDGKVIPRDVLELVLKYPDMLVEAYRNALNLTVNAGYPTKENIDLLLALAHARAEALKNAIGGVG